MLIRDTHVAGWEPAIYGMRCPMNSWAKSDSECTIAYTLLGPNDLDLMQRLIKGGAEHRKFLRQIQVWAFVELPRYVWSELDTYKVGTCRNSCSTMHKLGSRPLTASDFQDGYVLAGTLEELNRLGVEYRDPVQTDKVSVLRKMKMILPEGFLQGAEMSFNYEVLLNMYFQRRNHRLREWRATGESNSESICNWITTLPYMKQFIEWSDKKLTS